MENKENPPTSQNIPKHKIAGVLINLQANPEHKIKHSPQGLHYTLHLAVLAEPAELEWPPERFLLEELQVPEALASLVAVVVLVALVLTYGA